MKQHLGNHFNTNIMMLDLTLILISLENIYVLKAFI